MTVCFSLKPFFFFFFLSSHSREAIQPPSVSSGLNYRIVILCELKPYRLCCVFCVCVCVWVCVHMITHSSMQRQISVRKCKWSAGCRHSCSVLIQCLDANISTIHLQTHWTQQSSLFPASQPSLRRLRAQSSSYTCIPNDYTNTYTNHTRGLHYTLMFVCLRSNSNACTIAGTKSLVRACFLFNINSTFNTVPIKMNINIVTVFSLSLINKFVHFFNHFDISVVDCLYML